jgi:hypothetical protein
MMIFANLFNLEKNKCLTVGNNMLILTKGGPVLADTADYYILKDYHWHVYENPGYAEARVGNHTVYMHRLLIQPPPNLETDHKDGKRTNNKRSNLRAVTTSVNQLNRQRCNRGRKDPSSPIGVIYRSKRNKWEAQIQINSKYYYIGSFQTKEDAVAARAIYLDNYLKTAM